MNPNLICIAGSNGAGKSTFYLSHLQEKGLPFINADLLAERFDIDAYSAADLAESIRKQMLLERKSFIFETVFSDPVGAKVTFLEEAESKGYHVTLFFVYIDSADTSSLRVQTRVRAGGHDVPSEKIAARFVRTLQNLSSAITRLSHVIVLDNNSYETPHRFVAEFREGECVRDEPGGLPEWLSSLL